MSKEQVFVTIINASREAVWEALTSAEFTQQYWHGARARSTWEPGAVVDFLYFHYQDFHWPAFNLADSAITVGAVIIVIHALFAPDSRADRQTS